MRRLGLGTLAVAVCGAAVAALGACGTTASFTLSSDDNSPARLKRAFEVEKKPTAGKPINSTGKPMAFLVTAGAAAQKKLIAWDLAAGKQAWAVDADVTSRVVVAPEFVAAREGKDQIVARDLKSGAKLWSYQLGSKVTFLGAAADGNKVFVVQQNDSGKRGWELVALSGGDVAWKASAPGTLGAPAARGGLVYMPFLTQWLTVLDASSGEQLARIIQTDEAISYVRTTSDGVYYGSKGVLVLDENSVEGTREGATYGVAKLPEEFVRTFYHWDAFSAVQAGYSAFDRNRILWRAAPPSDKGFGFLDDRVVVFTYRFFFGFDARSGELLWAHNHPRNDVVSAEDVGPVILYVSLEGELGALDMKNGAKISEIKVGARITGATFDADGYHPKGEGTVDSTADALASIVWDKDKRFNGVKMFALNAMGTLPGTEVTKALLRVLLDESTPQAIYQRAAEVLVARKDPEAVGQLLEALEVHSDFIADTKPRAIDVIARALGAIGPSGKAMEAAPALVAHLQDPATPLGVVKDIAAALGDIGNPDALPALRSFLLVYRSDPMFASDTAALSATIDALLQLGGGGERELLSYVAEDDRTQPKVAEYARRALAQTAKDKQATAEAGAGGKPAMR